MSTFAKEKHTGERGEERRGGGGGEEVVQKVAVSNGQRSNTK